MSETALTTDKIIPAKAVQDKTSLSRTTLWRMSRKGEFPRPVKLSQGRVGYSASAVDLWLAARLEAA